MAKAALSGLATAEVEAPDFAPGLRIECDRVHLGSSGVEDAIHHYGIALHLGIFECLMGVPRPRHLQLADVGRGDLRKLGIADIVRAAVDGPASIGREGPRDAGREAKGKEQARESHWST